MKSTTKPKNDGDSPKNTEVERDHRKEGRMGRVCQICSDNRRLAIDKELVKGGNMTKIAEKYAISYSSLANHKNAHLTRQLVTATRIREVTHLEGIASDISSVYYKVMNALTMAEKKGKSYLFLECCRELRAYSEFLLKMEATFRRIEEQESNRSCTCPRADVVQIDVSGLDDITLHKLMKLLSEARVEGGKPIPAAPVRDTLH